MAWKLEKKNETRGHASSSPLNIPSRAPIRRSSARGTWFFTLSEPKMQATKSPEEHSADWMLAEEKNTNSQGQACESQPSEEKVATRIAAHARP